MNKGFKLLRNNFTKSNKYFSSTVSFVQRPGDSTSRTVTLIPGEGIGRDLTSNNFYLFI